MSSYSRDELKSFVLELFADSLEALGHSAATVPDDFDLLLEGVIDSLGVLEMVSAVEKKLGFGLDLSDLRPEDMTRIGPFCDYVMSLGPNP